MRWKKNGDRAWELVPRYHEYLFVFGRIKLALRTPLPVLINTRYLFVVLYTIMKYLSCTFD